MKPKGIITGTVLLFVMCATARVEAQSFGFLMGKADLVVAGEVVKEGGEGRFDFYSLTGVEVIRGELEDPNFVVVAFRDLSCRVRLIPGTRTLMFLKRLEGEVAGLDASCPAYVVYASELGAVEMPIAYEGTVLGAARRYAAAQAMGPGEKAAEIAGIFRTAVEADSEPLLYSAAYDALATPGVLDRIGSYETGLALDRFLASEAPSAPSRLRWRLMLFLAEVSPPDYQQVIESVVRSGEGRFYLDQAAAILSRIGDPESSQRLVLGFSDLDLVVRENVIHVLGHLGNGTGIQALMSVMWDHMASNHGLVVNALYADRSDKAVEALSQIVKKAGCFPGMSALEALAGINTFAARASLRELSGLDGIAPSLKERASELMAELTQ